MREWCTLREARSYGPSSPDGFLVLCIGWMVEDIFLPKNGLLTFPICLIIGNHQAFDFFTNGLSAYGVVFTRTRNSLLTLLLLLILSLTMHVSSLWLFIRLPRVVIVCTPLGPLYTILQAINPLKFATFEE